MTFDWEEKENFEILDCNLLICEVNALAWKQWQRNQFTQIEIVLPNKKVLRKTSCSIQKRKRTDKKINIPTLTCKKANKKFWPNSFRSPEIAVNSKNLRISPGTNKSLSTSLDNIQEREKINTQHTKS